MMVEIVLSAVATAVFGMIALIEYQAQDAENASKPPASESGRPVMILLGMCALVGNALIWSYAFFGG